MIRKIANLEISTWIGSYTSDAVHYYGKLVYADENGNTKTEYVTRTLTKSEAAEMNKYLARKGDNYRHDPGDVVEGFLDRDELIEAGKDLFKKLFMTSDKMFDGLLLLGDWYTSSAKKILISPGHRLSRQQVSELNDLWETYEKLCNSDASDKAVNCADDAWIAKFKEYCKWLED